VPKLEAMPKTEAGTRECEKALSDMVATQEHMIKALHTVSDTSVHMARTQELESEVVDKASRITELESMIKECEGIIAARALEAESLKRTVMVKQSQLKEAVDGNQELEESFTELTKRACSLKDERDDRVKRVEDLKNDLEEAYREINQLYHAGNDL